MMANQPAGRIGEDERKLVGEMVFQRPLLGDIGFEIWRIVAVEAWALAERGPAPLFQRPGAEAFSFRKDVLRLGIEIVLLPAPVVGLKVEPFAVVAGTVAFSCVHGVCGLVVRVLL